MSDTAAGLTYVAILANLTDKEIKAKNHEVSREEVHDAQSAFRCNDLWIPWCGSQKDYENGHKLSVGFTGTGGKDFFWLWERNGQIYINSKDQFDGGSVVKPDAGGKGGWRLLELKPASTGGQSIRIVDIKVN
jgi:hypothetical protein